jgi:hypothetical protein
MFMSNQELKFEDRTIILKVENMYTKRVRELDSWELGVINQFNRSATKFGVGCGRAM